MSIVFSFLVITSAFGRRNHWLQPRWIQPDCKSITFFPNIENRAEYRKRNQAARKQESFDFIIGVKPSLRQTTVLITKYYIFLIIIAENYAGLCYSLGNDMKNHAQNYN